MDAALVLFIFAILALMLGSRMALEGNPFGCFVGIAILVIFGLGALFGR